MSKFFIGALTIDSSKHHVTGLITRKPLLIALLGTGSMGTLWGQCARDVSAANAASFTAHNIPQATVASLGLLPATAFVFLSDQFSMPGQQPLPCDDGSHFLPQSVSQGFGLDGQSSPPIIVEPQPSVAQLLP